MTLGHVPDITPAGSAVPILPTPGTRAVWVVLFAHGGTCRFGDASINSTGGAALTMGTPFTLPRSEFMQGGYDLNELYVYASGADSISVTYAA